MAEGPGLSPEDIDGILRERGYLDAEGRQTALWTGISSSSWWRRTVARRGSTCRPGILDARTSVTRTSAGAWLLRSGRAMTTGC